MKKKILKLVVYLTIVYTLLCTELLSNTARLIGSRGYFVPKESSVFTFSVNFENVGNGEYWLYGEDQNYYYYSGVAPYVKIKKYNNCVNFNEVDYRTWCGVYIQKHDGYPE